MRWQGLLPKILKLFLIFNLNLINEEKFNITFTSIKFIKPYYEKTRYKNIINRR